jgi:hypothetical protein
MQQDVAANKHHKVFAGCAIAIVIKVAVQQWWQLAGGAAADS